MSGALRNDAFHLFVGLFVCYRLKYVHKSAVVSIAI